MFDTMTITKAGGALCGALLVFLLGNWAAEGLYHTTPKAHGDEEIAQAYVIDTGEDETATAEVDEGPTFEEVFAAADAGAGERVFRACQACHKLDGTDGTGPHLNGVVGREIGGVGGFNYSSTLAGLDGAWDPEALNGFLENPRGYAPGTSMGYAGLRKLDDRANLIAYLQATTE